MEARFREQSTGALLLLTVDRPNRENIETRSVDEMEMYVKLTSLVEM